jgi:hypothetical protein
LKTTKKLHEFPLHAFGEMFWEVRADDQSQDRREDRHSKRKKDKDEETELREY